MKKKIIALILTIGLLLSCLPFTTIAANAAVVVAENYTTVQGNYAYVNLRADNLVNVGALDIEIYYESSVMSLHYTSNGTLFNSASVSTNTNTSGLIKISAMAVNGLTSGTDTYSNRLMTICFKINSDCPVGDYPVFVAVGDAYDNDLNPTTISGVDGTVSVKQATAKSFPVYTTLSSTNVEQADELTLLAYHSSSASYKFASADFTIEYDYDLLKIKSIELDSKLLVEGAVYSINDSYPGMAIISYASTNAISSPNFFKITFEVIANVDAQTSVQIIASDVYDDELTAYSPYTATSSTIFITEKEVVPDYPDFRLESEKFIVGKPSDIFVVLEGNSKVAAADFVVNYDKDVFSINSVTADSNALSSGALIVINNNFNDGQIRFSYIMQNGDFAEDTKLVTISATPLISPDEHYTLTSSGIDVCDINFNDVTLDYIVDSDCIFLPTVIEPTCTEDGYTSYDCSCGESYTAEPTPSLGGHNYGDFVIDIEPTCTEEGSKSRHCSVCDDKTDITVIEANGHSYSTEWTIDIEPTCTEEGSKSHHCSVCDDKTDITVIEANGHSYGDWVVDIEPTCTEPGTATKACSECGDTQFAFFEKLLDSATYPESEHNYSDNINKIYNFSYPDAVALSITFSASTMIEKNYDYIYIYDAKGNLQGKYTGTELADATITLEGNSFSINLTSDGSRTYYGFSFDSIVAFGEGLEIIKPKGHSYGDWIIDTDPTCTEEGSKYKECSVCGDVVSEAIAENGHSYSTEWTIDIEPTCTEEGSKSRHCTVCGDKADITVIEANGHSYGNWIVDIKPTCTESGSAHKVCSKCNDTQDAVSELHLDSATYPESEHDYGGNTSKTYNFSYPDAVALKLTFSSSTKTEANRDIIYIYDSNGNLHGKYSGTELAGTTITLEGNSFSINLISDIGLEYYGFSFDSIVAVIEDDVIKPLGHKYSDEWTIDIEPTCTEEGSKSHHCTVCGDKTDITSIEVIDHNYEATDVMAAHPHTITYTCSDCGTEKAEDSIDSSCIECMHIVGLENTRVDYENHLIFTTIRESSNITEIIGVSETAKVIPIASHIFGDYEFLGTGTKISVYDNDVHIVDYTLIVSGDVNGDSVCDVLDCAQVALVTNNHKTLDDVYTLAADVCYDEVIDINDYQEIVNIALAS